MSVCQKSAAKTPLASSGRISLRKYWLFAIDHYHIARRRPFGSAYLDGNGQAKSQDQDQSATAAFGPTRVALR